MGYYDNVKDSIRDENDDESSEDDSSDSSEGISGNFDTLREAAEETKVEDEEGGDGTPIEVLEEDGLRKESPSQSNQQQQQSQRRQQSSGKQKQERKTASNNSNNQSRSQRVSGDTSELEDKLDKIIEQNSRMIEILESFGN